MAKISEETRLHFAEVIKPYKEKITLTIEKEKTNNLNNNFNYHL